MFQSLTTMPFVKSLKQQWLKFKRVVGSRVGYPHHFSKHKDHEEIVFIPARPRYCATVGGDIELFEQFFKASKPAVSLLHTCLGGYALAWAAAALFSRMNAEPDSSRVNMASKTITTSIQRSGYRMPPSR